MNTGEPDTILLGISIIILSLAILGLHHTNEQQNQTIHDLRTVVEQLLEIHGVEQGDLK